MEPVRAGMEARPAEQGSVAVEYAFLASLIALVIVAGVAFIGDWIRGVLDAVSAFL